MKTSICLLMMLFLIVTDTYGQLERQRVVAANPVELTFPTPRHIQLHTTEPLSKGELYYSIMHVFGTVDNGVSDFWGLDTGANVRFSLEYGFTDRFSAFIGRSSLDKIYESGMRLHLLRQMTDGSVPVSVSLILSGGIITEDFTAFDIEMSLADRLQAGVSLPVARKFTDSFSLMATPMYAVFSDTNPLLRIEDERDTYYAGLGTGGRYKLTNRTSVTFQHIFAYRTETGNHANTFGIGLDFETGGHVFQLFLTNNRSLNDHYLLASEAGDITDYAFRFGFNINRSFILRN